MIEAEHEAELTYDKLKNGINDHLKVFTDS